MRHLDYRSARQYIQTGDIVLYCRRIVTVRLIRLISRSLYSYAGLLLWLRGRLLVIGTTRRILAIQPFSESLADYSGSVHLYRPISPLASVQQELMLDYIFQCLGRKYNDAPNMFCSNLIATAYSIVGYDILEDEQSSGELLPDDIATSTRLVHVGVLRHE